MPKRWGRVDILVSKQIDETNINKLQKQLLAVNVVVVVFVIIVAFVAR